MGQPLPNQHHNIWTPELVEISLPLAGIARRIMARAVDQIILALVYIVLFFGMMMVMAAQVFDEAILTCVVLLLMAVLDFFYFTIFHAFVYGKTPGKFLLGIRVVTTRGGQINPVSALLRSLFNLLDMILFYGGISSWMIIITQQERRIADFAAGTIVIVD